MANTTDKTDSILSLHHVKHSNVKPVGYQSCSIEGWPGVRIILGVKSQEPAPCREIYKLSMDILQKVQ